MGGWYDLETKEFKYLCDITFIGAMGPPSQGRNSITQRFSRHFNLLYAAPFEESSIMRIFQNVLEWYFMNLQKPPSKAITNLRDKLISSTVQLYNTIKTSKELLPIPAKSHYVYNLRDISKVFQGVAKATHQSFKDENDFLRLWIHECMRVFQDRLINNEDRKFFEELLKGLVLANFAKDWSKLVTVEPLLWASFVPTIYPNDDPTKRPLSDIYCELQNLEALKQKCHTYLDEYNSVNPST